MDWIHAFDRQLFLLINYLPHTVFFDGLANFLSGIGTWGVVWIVVAIVLFFREEKKNHLFFVPSILVMLGAVISEFIFKAAIARPRPSVEMGAMIMGGADNFSFPSSHAVLAFAFAYVLFRLEPKFGVGLYFLAFAISLSRIYLGVHYPIDVIAGALLGLGLGRFALYCQHVIRLKK